MLRSFPAFTTNKTTVDIQGLSLYGYICSFGQIPSNGMIASNAHCMFKFKRLCQTLTQTANFKRLFLKWPWHSSFTLAVGENSSFSTSLPILLSSVSFII
jgi:hypothetical protein